MSDVMRSARGTLEMDLEGEAPAGVLTNGDGRGYRFSGWTELATAIEEWRSEARSAFAGDDARGAVTQEPARVRKTP